ncbi:MAG: cyclase family protein [Thermoanaerobaculia bacterium]
MRSLLMLTVVLVACSPVSREEAVPVLSLPAGTVVDLSHPYDESTVYWPTADGFELEVDFKGLTDKGFYYAANTFRTAEHGGTHIDAPIHFAEGRNTVDEIPLEQLMGQAVVIDVTDRCADDPDYLVTVGDIEQWEAEHGALPEGVIVLLQTGYEKLWPERVSYLGTDERGEEAVAKLHFPGLDPEAARWLVANRSINAIGLDTASIDFGQSTHFESHQVLFAADIPAFENLTNLHRLPATGFVVIALPMKIAGGSGGPLRVAAIVP